MTSQRCSITKTGKWLPLPISKCLQVSTMFGSLTAGLIKNILNDTSEKLLKETLKVCKLQILSIQENIRKH
jgi:hypothetical protein